MSDQDSLPPTDSSPPEQATFATATPGAHNLDRSVCAFDSFEYEADGHVFRATWPSNVTDSSTAVVSAVAVATDTDPMAIGPLHDAVDTDALDDILARDGAGDSDVEVAVTVDGHDVTVGSGGTLTVRPPEATDA